MLSSRTPRDMYVIPHTVARTNIGGQNMHHGSTHHMEINLEKVANTTTSMQSADPCRDNRKTGGPG